MISMIIQMSAITLGHVLLTFLLRTVLKGKKLSPVMKILVGLIYGACAILSTHFGIEYDHMTLNVRDLGPLSAGLYFDPVSGIIAGLVGGAERFIAGEFWGIGSYTRIACSVSTCLAGFFAAFLHIFIFKRKKPSAIYAFFMGSVMEVFHMYSIFITHRSDMHMAFYVVKICAVPMIVFSGIGLALSSVVLKIRSGEWKNPFRRQSMNTVRVSQRFQFWLFIATAAILLTNFAFSYMVQTQSAEQSARQAISDTSKDVFETYENFGQASKEIKIDMLSLHIGEEGSFDFVSSSGIIWDGNHKGTALPPNVMEAFNNRDSDGFFTADIFDNQALCLARYLGSDLYLLIQKPLNEVYESRDEQAYETLFGDILLLTVIYMVISLLVQRIVVSNLDMVNDSLHRITDGNLEEVVSVYTSSEFASLSDDINQTVDVLKGYIDAAEKRIEQELILAHTIQESSLPKNFDFPRDDFSLFASMDPAKEVGGDFYDFFFVGKDKLALVIADVSGKGIPAALFMMRSKTAIRSVAESGNPPAVVLERTNNTLCEGNDAEMFVTVWIGIIDLTNGHMTCANAGHEYPVIRRGDGEYELFREKHSPALATMEGLLFKEYEIDMKPGDSLFVYTDGIPEAINEEVVEYGTDRLTDVLNRHRSEEPKKLLPLVREDIRTFVGEADQFDDITMLNFVYQQSV